jgi:hypothetical protein
VISQFSQHPSRPSLADFLQIPNIYPAGRLDADSEGLMLLTDNGALQQRISHPDYEKPKTYLVQVEGLAQAIVSNDKVSRQVDAGGGEEKKGVVIAPMGWIVRQEVTGGKSPSDGSAKKSLGADVAEEEGEALTKAVWVGDERRPGGGLGGPTEVPSAVENG